MNTYENKRLFFGCEVHAPWPERMPDGRILEASQRHLTMAFLGNVPFPKMRSLLDSIPVPSFKVGLVGQFDRCLFLPKRSPRVVAWHANWVAGEPLVAFQRELMQWLQMQGYQVDTSREFLSHVTICRAPFVPHQWKEAFAPLPCLLNHLHLYESVGNLRYESLWQYSLVPAFEEMEHTADIAFRIRGENMQQLYLNAQYALAFHYPAFLPYLCQPPPADSLDQIIMGLNALVSKVDAEIGCPFKAVSFHGTIQQEMDHILLWEMVVDV